MQKKLVENNSEKIDVKKKIKDDNVIHYIHKKTFIGEKQERSIDPEKNSQWNHQAIWQHRFKLFSMIWQYISKYPYIIKAYPLTDIGEIMNG